MTRKRAAKPTEQPQRFRSRIVGHGEEAPDQLLANPSNFRIHPEDQQRVMEGVLDEVGFVQAVIVNKRTGHLIDGHLRVMLALRHEERMVPVTYVDLSEAEELLVLATLDPITGMAATDRAKVAELLESVTASSSAVRDLLATMGERASVDGTASGNHVGSLATAIQLRPSREYLVVMCADGEDGAREWAVLQERLGLTPVRRGGYAADSAFEAVSTQRVVKAAAIIDALGER